MEKAKRVIQILKPKVAAFGFSRKELQGIAAKIADDLTSADDAAEEDVDAEINAQIEAVLPLLQISQSYASRLAEAARHKDDDPDAASGDDDKTQPAPKPDKKTKADEGTAMKELLGKFEALEGEIKSLKADRLATSRRSRLEKLVDGSGVFGSRILKNFDKMSFGDDEEFEAYIEDMEADLKAYRQERADAGLSVTPPADTKGTPKGKEEPFSDAEIDALADIM